jgi:hypothetical protein
MIVCILPGNDVRLNLTMSRLISHQYRRCLQHAIEMHGLLGILELSSESWRYGGVSADDAAGLERIVPFNSQVCSW